MNQLCANFQLNYARCVEFADKTDFSGVRPEVPRLPWIARNSSVCRARTRAGCAVSDLHLGRDEVVDAQLGLPRQRSWKVPRRIACRVMIPNQVSIWFIQELPLALIIRGGDGLASRASRLIFV
jgi:hypothetical protein